jgi:outer membrane lipoprotein-sorting protein
MSGEIVIYNVFESYQNVDGIEYPNKIVTRNEQGQTLAELEFTEIKFNVDFPEDTFKTE